jgi:transcriptional regulator with XRE-family HTH domain
MTEPAFSFDKPTRAVSAARFRADLHAAFTRRKITKRELGRIIRVRPLTISDWLSGRQLPLPEVAARLAEELDAPHLVAAVLAARTISCEVCGKEAVAANKGSARMYCGAECKGAAFDRRRRGVTIIDSHLTRHRLKEHQDAVTAMCRECTLGESLCQQWQCPLRAVSPIPLSIAARREQAAAEASA